MDLKTKLRLFDVLFIATVIFWLSYTIVFLFIDGWHWKAEPGSLEYVLDATTSFSVSICVCVLLWACRDLIRIFVAVKVEDLKEKPEEKKPEPVSAKPENKILNKTQVFNPFIPEYILKGNEKYKWEGLADFTLWEAIDYFNNVFVKDISTESKGCWMLVLLHQTDIDKKTWRTYYYNKDLPYNGPFYLQGVYHTVITAYYQNYKKLQYDNN